MNCERCGREIKQGMLRGWDTYYTIQIGPLKGKKVCNECYKQLKPELEKILEEQQKAGKVSQSMATMAGSTTGDERTLRGSINGCVEEADRSVRGLKLAQFGFALTDDRTMWNISLLRGIMSLLKASLYYDELLIRRLDALEKAVTSNTATATHTEAKDEPESVETSLKDEAKKTD